MVKKYQIIGGIILFIFVIIFFMKNLKKMNKEYEKMNKEYPTLSLEKKICGEIGNVYSTQGSPYVTLTDSEKFSMYPSRNYEYDPIYIDDFLQIGDTIKKNKGSDSIYIYRNGEVYYFIHDKFVNQ